MHQFPHGHLQQQSGGRGEEKMVHFESVGSHPTRQKLSLLGIQRR